MVRSLGIAATVFWLICTFKAVPQTDWLILLCIALAVCLVRPDLLCRGLSLLLVPSKVAYTTTVAALTFILSIAFTRFVMLGAPLTIDAHIYLFEARLLSHGVFGASLPSPHLAA